MRAPPVVLAMLAAASFAGCILNEPPPTESGSSTPAPEPLPPGTLLCYDGVCNFEATVDPDTRQANELSIAVNPTDPLNIIATGKDYTPLEAGDCVWAGLYTTHDGGKTWKNQNVPGSNWRRLSEPTYPVHEGFSRFWCATDPVVAFGPDGTAYWTVMPYQCDRLSGSKTGRGVLPEGGLNDWFWTCSSMYVLVSHDGGETWPESQEVAFGPRLEHDKQWIATAPNGNVLLCWDRSENVAQTGTPADQLDPQSSAVCSVSTNRGGSWSDYAVMDGGFLPAVDYDANNTAYAVVLDGGNVLVTKSDDGLNWGPTVVVGNFTDPPAGGEYGWPVLEGSDFRTFAVPLIAVDRSNGTYGGSVYVTWFDHGAENHETGEGNIRVAYSRDGGATWHESPTPHDDNKTLKADQFFPAISVGPNGTVDVSWWDRRDDPNNHLFHVYYTYSKDGGQTWAPNLRVTDVASDEQYSHHQNGMVFLGDYRDQDSSSAGAHLVWVDTRNGQADVFVATVQR